METSSSPVLRANRSWLFPAVALGLLLLGSGVAYTITKDQGSSPDELTIKEVGENAFGDLTYSASGERSADGISLTADAPTVSSSGGGASDASTLVYPGFGGYQFAYNGPAVAQPESKLAVFKRIIPKGPNLGGLLGTSSPFNSSAFSNATIKSLSFTQGEDKYRADIDFSTGYLNISLDMVYSGPTTSSTSELSNERLIEIANAFVDDLGISRVGLGEPEVLQSLTTDIPAADLPASAEISNKPFYLSERTILYPMSINGHQVFDIGGNKVGMMLTINSAEQKVYYLSRYLGTSLESSMYTAETNFDTIKSKLSEGGVQKLVYLEGGERRTITVETPFFGYVQVMKYDESNYTSTELFAPAFIFPISEENQTDIYMKNIVVPLVEGVSSDPIRILQGEGSIEPMPAEAR